MTSKGKPARGSLSGLSLFEDFENLFAVVVADTIALKEAAYVIRHQTYQQHLGLEALGDAIDKYDDFAYHLLLMHRPSQRFAGTIRLITPRHQQHGLPFQEGEAQKNWKTNSKLSSLKPREYSEVSKLAVAIDFQRRSTDQNPLSENLNPIEEQGFAIGSHRDFPKITMGLCLASIALARQLFHEYLFAVMPPTLSNKLKGYGLVFDRVSHVFDRHGAKAVYRLHVEQGVQIVDSIYGMSDYISRQLAAQLHLLPDVNEQY